MYSSERDYPESRAEDNDASYPVFVLSSIIYCFMFCPIVPTKNALTNPLT